MNTIEVARLVLKEGAQLIRQKKEAPAHQYDAKPLFTGSKRGWIVVDSFSASALVAVYDALSEEKKAVFGNAPINRALTLAWKCVK